MIGCKTFSGLSFIIKCEDRGQGLKLKHGMSTTSSQSTKIKRDNFIVHGTLEPHLKGPTGQDSAPPCCKHSILGCSTTKTSNLVWTPKRSFVGSALLGKEGGDVRHKMLITHPAPRRVKLHIWLNILQARETLEVHKTVCKSIEELRKVANH